LTYSFVESVVASHWPYVGRAFGGFLYWSGMLVMAYNLYMTIKAPAPALENQKTNTVAA
jgi:cytochrome c oxidase cbb3-type subunit 1